MADTNSLYIDPETAALVDEIKNITHLSKAEIARQAFQMYREYVEKTIRTFSAPSPVTVQAIDAHKQE